VGNYSEDNWNVINKKYAVKQRNLPSYVQVPVVTSNRLSILENPQHVNEMLGERPQSKSSWAGVVWSRQKRAAYGKWQNRSGVPVANTCSSLSRKSDACDSPSPNKTAKQAVSKQSKKLTSPKMAKHKIVITGGSHGRECASKVKFNLENDFEVQGVINPGADLMESRTL
jgi:hypothetical protein